MLFDLGEPLQDGSWSTTYTSNSEMYGGRGVKYCMGIIDSVTASDEKLPLPFVRGGGGASA